VRTTILENLRAICQILNEHSIEYLVIGGAAVALHGYERLSKDPSGKDATVDDLDFWYNPTYDNYFKLLTALENLGEDVSDFKAEKAPNPKKSFFRLQGPKYTLDFLPEVPGLSLDMPWIRDRAAMPPGLCFSPGRYCRSFLTNFPSSEK
jgi:hypothetical protein